MRDVDQITREDAGVKRRQDQGERESELKQTV
jgi:hypothetical protein